eukprot:Gb_01525 [translate_table: standard]
MGHGNCLQAMIGRSGYSWAMTNHNGPLRAYELCSSHGHQQEARGEGCGFLKVLLCKERVATVRRCPVEVCNNDQRIMQLIVPRKLQRNEEPRQVSKNANDNDPPPCERKSQSFE